MSLCVYAYVLCLCVYVCIMSLCACVSCLCMYLCIMSPCFCACVSWLCVDICLISLHLTHYQKHDHKYKSYSETVLYHFTGGAVGMAPTFKSKGCWFKSPSNRSLKVMRDIMNPATKLYWWCMAQKHMYFFNGDLRQNESCYKSRVQQDCTLGMFPKILSILSVWIESTHLWHSAGLFCWTYQLMFTNHVENHWCSNWKHQLQGVFNVSKKKSIISWDLVALKPPFFMSHTWKNH